jgi:integrase/recombinase XerD
MSTLAPTVQMFFTDRLLRERHASPQTVAAYRDTWRLLLAFAAKRTGKSPSALDLEDIDVSLVCAFLDHLEHDRGNSVRTRNARLAAIHALFRFAALRHPEHADTIARVLAIVPKRFERAIVTFLTEAEVEALLAAPDRSSWVGRRDRALLLVAAQTGLRISELINLRCSDVHLGTGAPTSSVTEKGARSASRH